MKKILLTILASVMIFTLAACGRYSNSNESSTSTESEKDSDNENKISKDTAPEETSSRDKVDSVQNTKIRLKFGNEEVIVKMYDNPSSRELLAQLPVTITFEDYAGLEKIGYPPKELTTEGAPSGADPKLGDLALYSPWGNLAIYYGDSKYANGLVILGHIESGAEKFAKMNKQFAITIERMD